MYTNICRTGLSRRIEFNVHALSYEFIYYPFTVDNHIKYDTSDAANVITNCSKWIASGYY